MKAEQNRLTRALALAGLAPLAALAFMPAAHAGVPIGEIAGSDVSFEGFVQTDYYSYDSDIIDLDGDPTDGSDHDQGMRRAELVLEGDGPGHLDWAIGYDAHSEKWLDVNAKYSFGGDKHHYLKLGQFKQPNSLEELSSTKNNDFISKAMTTNTFGLSRRLGGAYHVGADDWGITASAFGRELTDDGDRGSGYGLRGTFAPVNADGNILHFGASYVDHDTDGDEARLRTRPQADFAGVRLVDSGTFVDADRIATTGLESFWVRGPLKLQGEVMQAQVDRLDGGDYTARGGYLSALWNLTGETWSYKAGVPGTAKPATPGTGMWQLGLRYDSIDMDDAGVAGGQMDTLTAGVNWYWQKNFKFMLNYVQVDSERLGVSDEPDIIEARAQFHW